MNQKAGNLLSAISLAGFPPTIRWREQHCLCVIRQTKHQSFVSVSSGLSGQIQGHLQGRCACCLWDQGRSLTLCRWATQRLLSVARPPTCPASPAHTACLWSSPGQTARRRPALSLSLARTMCRLPVLTRADLYVCGGGLRTAAAPCTTCCSSQHPCPWPSQTHPWATLWQPLVVIKGDC